MSYSFSFDDDDDGDRYQDGSEDGMDTDDSSEMDPDELEAMLYSEVHHELDDLETPVDSPHDTSIIPPSAPTPQPASSHPKHSESLKKKPSIPLVDLTESFDQSVITIDDSIIDLESSNNSDVERKSRSFIVIDETGDESCHSDNTSDSGSISAGEFVGWEDTDGEEDDLLINANLPRKRKGACVIRTEDNLEDVGNFSLEDIHDSLGDGPPGTWSTQKLDKFGGSRRLSGRYYQPIKVRCHNCNEMGHLSKICPQPRKKPVCIYCGLEGHFYRNCPDGVRCDRCFNGGHTWRDCPRPRSYDSCRRCGMYGHINLHCPEIWQQYHLIVKHLPVKATRCHENKRRYCCNCSGKNHYNFECRVRRQFLFFPLQPFIQVYKQPYSPTEDPLERRQGRHQGYSLEHEESQLQQQLKDLKRQTRKKDLDGPPQKVLKKAIQSNRSQQNYIRSQKILEEIKHDKAWEPLVLQGMPTKNVKKELRNQLKFLRSQTSKYTGGPLEENLMHGIASIRKQLNDICLAIGKKSRPAKETKKKKVPTATLR